MKKNTILLYVMAFAAASCSVEQPVQIPAGEADGFTIEALSPENLISKTTLVDNTTSYSVNWTSSDVISVNGQSSSSISINQTDPRIAVFSFADDLTAPYLSVYPSSAYKAESLSGGKATVIIPAEQTYVAGNFDPAASIMIGKSETAGKLSFVHAVSYMQIKVTTSDGAKVKSVSIKGNAGETMSGEFTATFADSTLENEEKAANTVSVICAEGFDSGNDAIIAIPAREYTAGVSVTITDVNGHSKLLKSTKAFTAEAGVVYSTEMELKGKGIWGVNDYIAFAEAVNAGDYSDFVGEDGEVNLMADITLASGNFKYITAQFDGIFDGNSHTLTSPSRSTPLFAEIGENGIVKNLNTAGAFTSFANGTYCAASSFAKINYGLIDNCVNSVNTELTFQASNASGLTLGCFVGQNGGIIRDSKNTGKTIINAKLGSDATYTAFSASCTAGGFAAIGHAVPGLNPGTNAVGFTALENVKPGQFVRCTNEGELSITVAAPAKKTGVSAVGGICGFVRTDGVKFDSCTNKGAITRLSAGEASNDGTSGVGGILGMSAIAFGASNPHAIDAGKGFNTVITGCSNSGTVVNRVRYNVAIEISTTTGLDGKANRHASAGGIVGIIIGTASGKSTVSNCNSTGLVTSGWDANQRHFVGGVSGYSKYTDFTGNTMSGSLTSYEGLSVGVVGGLVGAAYEGVAISGGSSKPTMNCVGAGSVDLCIGLCVGVSLGNVSISNVKVGGSATYTNKKEPGFTISKANWESFVYKELANTTTVGDNPNYSTKVENVVWED